VFGSSFPLHDDWVDMVQKRTKYGVSMRPSCHNYKKTEWNFLCWMLESPMVKKQEEELIETNDLLVNAILSALKLEPTQFNPIRFRTQYYYQNVNMPGFCCFRQAL
jgi:hypothetical protein